MSKARNAAPKNLRARLITFRKTLANVFKPTRVFDTDGGKKTAAQLIADLDAALKPFNDVDAQRIVLDGLLAARKKGEPFAREVGDCALAVIRTAHPLDHPLLQSKFLRNPGGDHKLNSGQKFLANVKRQKSRKLTGVMGKHQRAAKLRGE